MKRDQEFPRSRAEKYSRAKYPAMALDGEGKLSKTNGTSLVDILKLPEVWPPAERGPSLSRH